MTQKIKIETIQLEKLLTHLDQVPEKIYRIVKITNSVDWEIGQNLTKADIRNILGTNSQVEIVVRQAKNSDFG
jgi:phenylalanyl-tRNA synthetase beta subunit